jgi:hypothetical protein
VQVCQMVDGDAGYGAAIAWCGAGMVHMTLSDHIPFVKTCLTMSEVYLEAAFLL